MYKYKLSLIREEKDIWVVYQRDIICVKHEKGFCDVPRDNRQYQLLIYARRGDGK
jgi:hypothetical protein